MYKLSPSDFAFLYEECKLCYYLKVKEGIYQPSMPMPGVFSAINTRLQSTLIGKDLRVLSGELPEGKVEAQEGWVDSKPIEGTSVYIKGKYDLLARRADGTTLLIDLKISQPHDDKIEKYKYQLGAYKYALENPATGAARDVAKMGLLVFYPDRVSMESGEVMLSFPPKWLEIPWDEKGFFEFMRQIDELLSAPPPQEGEDCKWCKYRHFGEEISHKKPVQDEIPF